MNRIYLFSSILIIFFSLSTKSQSLTPDQTKDVESSVIAFMSALAEYSNCKGDNYLRKQIHVKELHDGNDETDLIFNDLFSSENDGGIFENYNWGQYFSSIKNDFHNEIHVEFKNISVLDCIVRDGNNLYVYATLEKTLTYKNQKSTYTILISVNINNHNTIKEIVSPLFFKNSKNGSCDIGFDKTDIAAQVTFLRSIADAFFQKKDYLNAKISYLAISNKMPNDLTIKTKIEDCTKLITLKNLSDKADELYQSKKYENAKQLYQDILDSKQGDNETLLSKINLCIQGITDETYKYNLELADYFFGVANFENARTYYSRALVYKPTDSYILMQIAKSKNGDVSFVNSEIDKAKQLSQKRRNYPEVFKILTEYELSGLLKTENYYFLTLMMFKQFEDVRNIMGYNKENCKNYLNIYVKKLKEINKMEQNSKVNFLIDEVINSRYQK